MMVRNTLAFLLLLLFFQICFRAFKSLAQTLRKNLFYTHRTHQSKSEIVIVGDCFGFLVFGSFVLP